MTDPISDRARRPCVSVVLPVYNGESHLREAVSSVLRQSMSDVELLIVDDGSSDDSASIAHAMAKQDPRIRAFCRERNSGLPAVPRNEGVRESRGEFIAFIDHDDVWFARKLERQLNLLRSRSDLAMVHSYMWAMAGRNPLRGLRELCPPREKHTTYATMLNGNQVQMSSVLIRRETLDLLGGFSEDERLRAVEDFELWLRLAESHAIGYIPEVHGLYRIRANSISRATDHRGRLDYLDKTRGTRFLESRGSRSRRVVHRIAVTPAALWAHLADGATRYWVNSPPRVA